MKRTVPADPLAAALRSALVEAVREAVRDEIALALAELREETLKPRPALLTIDGLAAALSLSRSSINKLRAEGMPEMRIGDSPRFKLEAVIAWLDKRTLRGDVR